ncbi:MAG: prepilin-type N-terminal cleavage/methylation domain-containing protein [Gemmatimonadales bacterium]
MPRRHPGFTLIEVLLAVVTFAIGVTALLKLVAQTAEVTGMSRRWLAMVAAVESQTAQLERAYREAAPACALPAAGVATTVEGIGLAWIVTGDTVGATITIEARAALARRTMVDTVVTAVTCR